ncbi:MAG: TerB family tellurite resistance protein [Cyanobacteria bacterium J06623_7]
MVQSIKQSDRHLLEILIAIAWIDGEVQPAEKQLIEQIALENNLISAADLPDLLAQYENSSTEQCYQLLQQYIGANPTLEVYDNLLSAVSKLIYSDNDIATAEADLLTKIQDLDPQKLQNHSTFDHAITKIQRLYQKALKS